MKLVYQYMPIFFNLSPTSNHLHPLQVENCDSNSRLVVDEDDNVKSGLQGLNMVPRFIEWYLTQWYIYSSDKDNREITKLNIVTCQSIPCY